MDRWLFRYIVMFLRDGFLPNDRMLLSQVRYRTKLQIYHLNLNISCVQLYREALFWNLIELRRAIEDDKVIALPQYTALSLYITIILL